MTGVRRRALGAALAAAVLAAGALTGCSGDDPAEGPAVTATDTAPPESESPDESGDLTPPDDVEAANAAATAHLEDVADAEQVEVVETTTERTRAQVAACVTTTEDDAEGTVTTTVAWLVRLDKEPGADDWVVRRAREGTFFCEPVIPSP